MVVVFASGCAVGDSESSPSSAVADASTRDGAASSDGGKDATSARDSAADASVDSASACVLVKPYSSKDPTCNACAEEYCCAEVNDCRTNAACETDYVDCILACALFPDDAGPDVDASAGVADCIAACDANFPEGSAKYAAATGCVDTKCINECGN